MFPKVPVEITSFLRVTPLSCVQLADAQEETLTVVEKCCHRVDALEETVVSLWEDVIQPVSFTVFCNTYFSYFIFLQ